jgi:hypothetical protein
MTALTVSTWLGCQVWERDKGLCQRCGKWVALEQRGVAFGWSVQHRKHRSRGGDNRMSNLIVLCGSGTTLCHGWVEGNPLAAQEDGWAVPGWVPNEDIYQHPVSTPWGLCMLDDEGGYDRLGV